MRRPRDHDHIAHPNHSAAGANEKTPSTEMKPTTSSAAETIARGIVHRFHATKVMPKATIRKRAAITLDVVQSQVTAEDWLPAEQPHGRDAITNTDSRTAARAAAANPTAILLVVRTSWFAAFSETNLPSLLRGRKSH